MLFWETLTTILSRPKTSPQTTPLIAQSNQVHYGIITMPIGKTSMTFMELSLRRKFAQNQLGTLLNWAWNVTIPIQERQTIVGNTNPGKNCQISVKVKDKVGMLSSVTETIVTYQLTKQDPSAMKESGIS